MARLKKILLRVGVIIVCLALAGLIASFFINLYVKGSVDEKILYAATDREEMSQTMR